MKKNNRKGFTIVELAIVIAVIAILAGVLIPTFSGIVTKAKENAALQEARTIYTQYISYMIMDDEEIEQPFWIKSGEYYFKVENDSIDDTTITQEKPTGVTIVTKVDDEGNITTEKAS